MDELDDLFRRYLKEREKGGASALSDEEVRLLTAGQLDLPRLENVLERLSHNPEDRAVVAAVRRRLSELKEAEVERVDEKLIRGALSGAGRSAPCPHCGKPITPFKKAPSRQRALLWLWGALCFSGFALSFVFKPYFFQCLAVSLLAGFKWALDARSLKSQILIYRALAEAEPPVRRGDLQRDDARI